jgi:D-aminopeptidase
LKCGFTRSLLRSVSLPDRISPAEIEAIDGARSGPVAEGNVGGGTGMICHEFKGDTGTSLRTVRIDGTRYTVGALMQANYGQRELLRIDGVPVGREIGRDVVPSHRAAPEDAGSIIVVLATDAPLLPIQCQRLARRATTSLAWVAATAAAIFSLRSRPAIASAARTA